MAVRYKLLKTTGGLPKNADFKVVPMEYGTVGLKQMQGHIERATSLTLADLVGGARGFEDGDARPAGAGQPRLSGRYRVFLAVCRR